jgi:uncharacterized OsmC-like protein
MNPTLTDTIDRNGDPLAFKVKQGTTISPALSAGGSDVFRVEARQMAGHQKEAVVTEGTGGSAWRLTSDEGKALHGTDLAPFPLGFFNAGLQGDLYRRMRRLAAERNVALNGLEIRLANNYSFTGSFIQGSGEGHADPSDIELRLSSPASQESVERLVAAALQASPAIGYLRTPLTSNTFALYINGRRRTVDGVPQSTAPDTIDPYRVYPPALRPLDPDGPRDLVEKTPQQEAGESQASPATTTTRVGWQVLGLGRPTDAAGALEVDTWLGRPGASHFRLRSDESDREAAPSGLALLSTAVAFCYMTQLSRYIENMKLNIHGARLVQFIPYTAGQQGELGAIDTHLFLNGEAPEELHRKLLTIAANTCYLHAAAKSPLSPKVRVRLNGRPTAQAA